jgi:hypothetical protein
MDSYGPQYGASAVSANGLARYTFAAVFPLFAIQSEYTTFCNIKNIKVLGSQIYSV